MWVLCALEIEAEQFAKRCRGPVAAPSTTFACVVWKSEVKVHSILCLACTATHSHIRSRDYWHYCILKLEFLLICLILFKGSRSTGEEKSRIFFSRVKVGNFVQVRILLPKITGFAFVHDGYRLVALAATACSSFSGRLPISRRFHPIY